MTMSQFSVSGEITSDAEFRAFVAGYRAALTAAGFVRTSDTGQIDPTTVVKPASPSGIAGYEIWRFNDTAQATKPIFFKLEYAVASSVNRYSFWITVGTGSNGSGTITGILVARGSLTVTGSSALAADTWVSGGDGYLASGILVGTAQISNSGSMGWMIERLRDASGVPDISSTGAGIVVARTSSTVWSAVAYDGAWSELTSGTWPALNPSHTAANGLYRGTTYAYPYHPMVGIPRPPCRAAVCAFPVDTGHLAPFTIDLYGVPHIFRSPVQSATGYGRGNSVAPAMRYE